MWSGALLTFFCGHPVVHLVEGSCRWFAGSLQGDWGTNLASRLGPSVLKPHLENSRERKMWEGAQFALHQDQSKSPFSLSLSIYLNPGLRKSSQRLELLPQVDVRVLGVWINFLQHLDLLLREVGPLPSVSQYCDALFRTLRGIRSAKVVPHIRRPWKRRKQPQVSNAAMKREQKVLWNEVRIRA